MAVHMLYRRRPTLLHTAVRAWQRTVASSARYASRDDPSASREEPSARDAAARDDVDRASDDARKHDAEDAGAGAGYEASRLPPPPANWHKRGRWIDPAVLERRMLDDADEPSGEAFVARTPVERSVASLIRYRGGPISVAEYMREVLTHPRGGFYAARGGDAIAAADREGHFITAPEISSLFAECLAAWTLQHLDEFVGPTGAFALIELGPGRGTLLKQLLTALRMMPGGAACVARMHVHLVEVSSGLRDAQYDALRCAAPVRTSQLPRPRSEASDAGEQDNPYAASGRKSRLIAQHVDRLQRGRATDSGPGARVVDVTAGAATGVATGASADVATGATADMATGASPDAADSVAGAGNPLADPLSRASCRLTGGTVSWHDSLAQVPTDMPAVIIVHEFLDAMPVHIFRKDEKLGWLEVLVNEAAAPSRERAFDFILSPSRTAGTEHVLQRRLAALGDDASAREALEVSAEAMAVAEALALRVDAVGGAALLVDYGQDGPYDQSLNAIRAHTAVHPLEAPGAADLTAWVDFSAVRQAVRESGVRVTAHGPITQQHFLLASGMEQRLDALLRRPRRTRAEVDALEDGFARLVAGVDHHPQGMGQTYKVMAVTRASSRTPFPFAPEHAPR